MNKKFLAGSAVLLMASCSSYYTEPYSLLGAEKTNIGMTRST